MIANHSQFEMFMLFLILASCVLLALDNPHREAGDMLLHDVLAVCDITFTLIFLLELIIKVTSNCFNSYICDAWNALDAVIALTSTGTLILTMFGASDVSVVRVVKVIRVIRTLRPLRLVTRSLGIQRVVECIVQSIPEIANIWILLVLLWFIYAILGVQLLAGKLLDCTDIHSYFVAEVMGANVTVTKLDGQECKQKRHGNFNNVFEGMLTVYELASMEDWNVYMYEAMDATGVDSPPKLNDNPLIAVYFVSFIMGVALFVGNLFISAVVNQYLMLKGKTGSVMMTESQLKWVGTLRVLMRQGLISRFTAPEELVDWLPHSMPKLQSSIHNSRKWCFDVGTGNTLSLFSMLCIVGSVVTMLVDHYEPSAAFERNVTILNVSFNGFFMLEAIIKIIGLGPRQYIWNPWNAFDFLIVLLAVMNIVLFMLQKAFFNTGILRALRIFRALRTLRMLRSSKGVRMLLQTFLHSLPSLYNVGALLFLVFYVYTLLGVHLFGDMDRSDAITDRTNFESFGHALFLLFRCCLGENWNAIFHKCRSHSWVAVPYFTTFLLIVSNIMLNLFIAIILDHFSEAQESEELTLTPADVALFASHWSQFDPQATMTIRTPSLVNFLGTLQPALGFSGEKISVTHADIVALNIPDHQGVVHYYEVLGALAYRLHGTELPETVSQEMNKELSKRFPSMQSLPPAGTGFREALAVMQIQKQWRGVLGRRKFRAALAMEKNPEIAGRRQLVAAHYALRRSTNFAWFKRVFSIRNVKQWASFQSIADVNRISRLVGSAPWRIAPYAGTPRASSISLVDNLLNADSTTCPPKIPAKQTRHSTSVSVAASASKSDLMAPQPAHSNSTIQHSSAQSVMQLPSPRFVEPVSAILVTTHSIGSPVPGAAKPPAAIQNSLETISEMPQTRRISSGDPRRYTSPGYNNRLRIDLSGTADTAVALTVPASDDGGIRDVLRMVLANIE
ncbi:hypothetical protein CYMTET_13629 [Cymbomonas tetramitiformis]|uniref:Uncharacterized protein n=1 Tax=Cymbomonas tetramitiformis TaxID=36881 RepID=A0AAE0GI29_9CHLO|nr:hypothetical protein CYMTET_13629 [Cymbomonas tetramitiformis]